MHITTERLHIRNMREEDLFAFHAYRSNPEIAKYQGFDVMNESEAKDFITQQISNSFGKPGQWVQYTIASISSKQLIGDCAIKLFESDPRIAEIGITISHLEQRKGYAKEAMIGLLQFLFEEKNIHRIVEIVDVENIAAVTALENGGFRKEGHFIENIFFNGKWGSEYQFAMLRKEWDKMQD